MNESQQRSILQAAARDKSMVALVPPVVALGFGVLALSRMGDVLTVACSPAANRQALRLLRAVLRLEVVATPFEDRLLREAVKEAYADGGEAVNFPTFQEREFLADEASAEVLRREKVEDLGPIVCELPADRLVLLTLDYRTRLTSLDRGAPGGALPDPARSHVELAELETCWRAGPDGSVTAWLPGAELPPKARLLWNEVRTSETLGPRGRREEQAARGVVVEALPHVIHPSEVQLTGIAADGALSIHAYDRRERLAPGSRGVSIRVVYQFLSWGERLERTIELLLHDLRSIPRAELRLAAPPMPWGKEELGRWLGVSG